MSMAGKWGYTDGGESYFGTFGTPEEAAIESGLDHVQVGQFREPVMPESVIDADDLIEQIICQDDYNNDWGEDWPDDTEKQRDELTAAVRKVFGEWLDKHGLRPKWGMVDETTIRQIDVSELKAEQAS